MQRHTPPRLGAGADAREAIVWLRELTKWIGPGFHPDVPGNEYVAEDGTPLLSAAEASRLDADMARACAVLDAHGRTPYDIAIKVQRRLLGCACTT